MAIYQGGYNKLRSDRIRMISYIVAAGVFGGIVLAIGYVWVVRGRSATVAADVPPAAPMAAVIEESSPAEPVTVEQPEAVEQMQPQGAGGKKTPENTVAQQAEVTPQPEPESPQSSAPPAGETAVGKADDTVPTLIAEAMELLSRRPPKIIEARDRLNELLPMVQGQQREFVKQQLATLAQQWLFSKLVFPGDKLCGTYKVSPGDMLSTIGKQHNVPYEILMQINGIDRPELLRADDTIKVINGPFHAKVFRSAFTMDLYLQNTYVRSFPVGLGKAGMETPLGRWRVKEGGKLVKPIWTDPVSGRTYHPEDPDYPLGSRWIALEGLSGEAAGRTGFAIHGTNDPQQIGTMGSQGCIRLHNGDAVLVYNLLMPGASLVDVVE